jgi:DNA-binding SARP family transcriptional activator
VRAAVGHGTGHETVQHSAVVEVRVLGTVEIRAAGRVVTLPRGGERCVLATLAFSPGRRVHVDVLVEHVWGDEPPANAEQTIASYVRAVRRAVEQAGGRREWLRNHRPGAYQLDIAPDLVDYHRFRSLIAAARADDSIATYQEALALRRGEALADVPGQWARDRRYAVEQEYLDALCALYELQLGTGECAAVATSALHLISEVDPSDRLILLAVRGLAGSGQHAAIPEFVERASRRMWEVAGARPGPEVETVARELVAQPSGPAAPRPAEAPAEPGPPQSGAPAPEAPDSRTAQAPRAVVLRADHNGRVYQAAGDQYIVEAG